MHFLCGNTGTPHCKLCNKFPFENFPRRSGWLFQVVTVVRFKCQHCSYVSHRHPWFREDAQMAKLERKQPFFMILLTWVLPLKPQTTISNKYIPKKIISGYIHSFESPPVERATSIHDLHPISDLLI